MTFQNRASAPNRPLKSFGHVALAGALALSITACTQNGNWYHHAHIDTMEHAADDLKAYPDRIAVYEQDRRDRVYQAVGNLRVRVGRITTPTFEATKQDLDYELKKAAAHLGADAVVNVRYGNRTVAELQWLTMDATGTAIKYLD